MASDGCRVAQDSSSPCKFSRILFRRLLLQKLRAAHKADQLQFFGQHAHLAEPKAFAAYLAPLRKIEWYLYLKSPFGGPEAVLAYLSRYTHRVAIANSRLIAFDENGVTFRYKDYRADGRARYKTHDARHRRVHPPLPHPRPAARLPPHPPLRPVRQWQPCRQYRTRPRVARRAVSPKTTRDIRATAEVDQPRMLSRPCPCCGGRMIIIETFARGCHAEAPPHTGSARDQDRYLMTLSPLTDNRPDTHSSGHLVAGNAQARIGPLDRPAVAPQMLPELQSVPSPSSRSSDLRANTIAASAPIQTTHASRRAQIPIACTAPPAHHRSRFRALALFGRRPIERVTAIHSPASKNLHRMRHSNSGGDYAAVDTPILLALSATARQNAALNISSGGRILTI